MWIEDYSPDIDSSEWVWNSAEAAKDASEKYQEATKKSWAKVTKTRKDEKKAKKYDFLLAGFLVKIIVDKKYDSILDTLFPTIHWWYPSNFVLWILSIINNEISNKIRETSNKKLIEFNYSIQDITKDFDDNNIDKSIRDRINNWVEDITDSVTLEYSNIQTQKLKQLLIKDNTLLLTYTSKVFSFFLKEININITQSKSLNISEFILSEVKKSIDKLEIENI
jgi:hypothetical protein